MIDSKTAAIQLAFQKLDNKLKELEIRKEKDLQTVIRLAGDIVGQVKAKRELIKQERYENGESEDKVEVGS